MTGTTIKPHYSAIQKALTSILLVTIIFILSAPPLMADIPENKLPPKHYTTPIAPENNETAFDFKLNGYIFGIKMISARYKGVFDKQNYSIYTDLKTSGLGALLKKLRIWATTEGFYDNSGIYPIDHTQQNLDKKSRRVEMDYDYKQTKVNVLVVPPNSSQGIPPASAEQRFQSDDVISAILKIMMTGHALDGEICNDNVKVFDSKQHYNLRLEHVNTLSYKFDGQKYPAIKCHIYYEPVSGFDPEDLPNEEESSTPISVYFINRPEYKVWVPVKFTYKISGFKAKIKIKDLKLLNGPIIQDKL